MKNTLFFLLLIIPLLVSAQEAPFTISGEGNAFKDGDKLYLVYRANNKIRFDSTVVSGGRFKFKGNIKDLVRASLYKNENPMVLEKVTESAEVYIEPANILIFSNDSLKNARITGTQTNIDNIKLLISLRPIRAKWVAASIAYEALTAEQQKDIRAMASIQQNLREVNAEMAPVQLEFIRTHPNSYISLVTLQQIVNTADIGQVAEAYNTLSPELKAMALGAKLSSTIAAAKQSSAGLMAAHFTLPDPSGRAVKLADFKGQYVLVDFWASWCLPCRAENPNLKLAYEKYKAKGFTIISISIDDDKNAWRKAIKVDGLPWTQVLDHAEEVKTIKDQYGVTTIPANVLVDPSGKIIAKNLKDRVLMDKLEQVLSGKGN